MTEGRLIEAALKHAVRAVCDGAEGEISRALSYAVGSPGKRLRPRLVLATAAALGRPPEAALDAACAMELVHCSSLILDDLPAMDNASLRRGRTATHLEFGEATAILAAHALLGDAFRLVTLNCSKLGLTTLETAETVALLAHLIGPKGMIGGQSMDLSLAATHAPEAVLEDICRLKTASLFRACVRTAGNLCEAPLNVLEGLELFAERLGMAFQIHDDILDVVATPESSGKNVRQDTSGATLAHRIGVEEAQARARSLEREALACLEDLEIDGGPLMAFVALTLGAD